MLGAPHVSIVSWNLRSLALANTEISHRTKSHVSTLAAANNVVFLLEARASLPFLTKWSRQWQASHVILTSVSAAGDTKAGIMVLIQKAFLQNYGIKHTFGSVFAGRVCWVLLESDKGLPLYILASHIERFSVEMIASVRNKRIELGTTVGLALPRPGLGIILRDYNFVNHLLSLIHI